MNKAATISIYHDTRHGKANGLYAVKLRVYFNGSTRLFSINYNLTPDEFASSYLAAKPRGEKKELKLKLSAVEQRANDIAGELNPFSFEKFERRMFTSNGNSRDVIFYYNDYICKLDSEDRAGTSSNYQSSLTSLKKYIESLIGKEPELISFNTINKNFLQGYEKWMLDSGNSLSTIGIYLRPLRAIFNLAIAEGDADSNFYPFKQYAIPASRNIKKALSKEDLKKLYSYQVDNELVIKARHFWFFSYQANGMNMKDICELKIRNLNSESIVFTRSKTLRSTIKDSRPIVVPLTPFLKSVIDIYGNKDGEQNDYVFPMLQRGMDGKERRRLVQNFTRFVNENIKWLAGECGISKEISTYWARHSFTTVSIREGASMEVIQESLGHSSMATTQKYWAGFEAKAKKELADKLMNF